MKIAIAGASGFVGSAISRMLLARGDTVLGLGTSAGHPLTADSAFEWIRADTTRKGDWQQAVADADAVINLAGRTIFKRWSRAYKQQIVASRVQTTRNVVAAMAGSDKCLLSTSAVGYYGSRGDALLDENSTPGDDFLAQLSLDWEAAAHQAVEQGVRLAIMRFGVVLGAHGGALAQMLPAFRRFVGGPLGSGRQWFAWIHLADLLAATRFLLETETAHGVYNFCAPEPVRQGAFARALGRALGRPAVLPAPGLALRIALGEVAGVLLASQRVHPKRLLAEGFGFQFPALSGALADLVARPS